MSNSLQGQINEDTLTSLLQFLAMNHNTGCLKLKQAGMAAGEIFFDQGRIVHAYYADMKGVEALSYFLTWSTGRFIFRNGVAATEQTIHISLESALLEAAYQADTYNHQPTVSALSIHVILQTRSLKEQTLVSLSFGALNLLRELDGRRDLAFIARDLGWSQERILRAAQELHEQDLVQVHQEEPVAAGFIDELRQVLIYIMGPIGEFVIDDALNATGTNRENLTRTNAQEFLQEISNQLDQENWQQGFTAQASEVCAKYGIAYKASP